jgi:hypothetical protein
MALDLDFLTRVVNVKWTGAPEQGLLATGSVFSLDTMVAIALDTGESFPGISCGATGNAITVLTSGIVVFGEPRDGDACFMACIDGRTILRGIDDDKGGIAWSPIHNVAGLTALSFAKDAFFVTYSMDKTTDPLCALSFDGQSFSEIGNIYSSVPPSPPDLRFSGAIAHNGTGYAAAGMYQAIPSQYDQNGADVFFPDDYSMMWAFSNNGTAWGSGYSPNETTNPGANPVGAPLADFISAYTNIAGGAGLFVAAATTRIPWVAIPVEDTGTHNIMVTRATASAAVSDDGHSWTTIPLPGVIEGDYSDRGTKNNSSYSDSVAFIKTENNGSGGYFLISSNGILTQGEFERPAVSWCHKGDGHSWSLIKSDTGGANGYGTVSAIAKDLSSTRIVYLRR